MPFAPTAAAFFRIDFIMPASLVKPVLAVEFSSATSLYSPSTADGVE
jgi:hypothetical protein